MTTPNKRATKRALFKAVVDSHNDNPVMRLLNERMKSETAAIKCCTITGNECGTDTWAVGSPPDCECGRASERR